jgi:hypothetical protein
MNTTEAQTAGVPMPQSAVSEAAGHSVVEAIGAIGAIILTIIGLAGILSNLMASVATLVIGAGFLGEGWADGANHRRRLAGGAAGEGADGGLSAEFLGGMAGIVLGILATFRMVPDMLLAVALLVFGATLLLHRAVAWQAYYWSLASRTQGTTQTWPREAPGAGSSGHWLVGLGAVVLGILAVIGLVPITLILVGLLGLGTVMLFSQFRFA